TAAESAALSAPLRPLVTLEQATVRFRDVTALSAIDLSLHRGERLIVVGTNGAGKTTLLRLLHGLLPCSGKREIFPVGPDNRAPVMAMLFQRPFLLSFSVRWNVLPALWLQGVRNRAERERRCHEALQRVGLDRLANRPARSLSGGQQQRLALARAWVVQPDLLLLDEPTANLDPSAKREVEALIEEIARAGVTIVITTHNLGQAKRLGSPVAHLAARAA